MLWALPYDFISGLRALLVYLTRNVRGLTYRLSLTMEQVKKHLFAYKRTPTFFKCDGDVYNSSDTTKSKLVFGLSHIFSYFIVCFIYKLSLVVKLHS